MGWFVGYVRSCQERNVARMLNEAGIEVYVALRREVRQWSDRKVIKDVVLLPRTFFVRCDEARRYTLAMDFPYITGFLIDHGNGKPAVVSDAELSSFRALVEGSGVKVRMMDKADVGPGDRVRICAGPLQGMECEVAEIKNKSYICVRMGLLGTAVAEVNVQQIEKI